jgi:hypothetical protein
MFWFSTFLETLKNDDDTNVEIDKITEMFEFAMTTTGHCYKTLTGQNIMTKTSLDDPLSCERLFDCFANANANGQKKNSFNRQCESKGKNPKRHCSFKGCTWIGTRFDRHFANEHDLTKKKDPVAYNRMMRLLKPLTKNSPTPDSHADSMEIKFTCQNLETATDKDDKEIFVVERKRKLNASTESKGDLEQAEDEDIIPTMENGYWSFN